MVIVLMVMLLKCLLIWLNSQLDKNFHEVQIKNRITEICQPVDFVTRTKTWIRYEPFLKNRELFSTNFWFNWNLVRWVDWYPLVVVTECYRNWNQLTRLYNAKVNPCTDRSLQLKFTTNPTHFCTISKQKLLQPHCSLETVLHLQGAKI